MGPLLFIADVLSEILLIVAFVVAAQDPVRFERVLRRRPTFFGALLVLFPMWAIHQFMQDAGVASGVTSMVVKILVMAGVIGFFRLTPGAVCLAGGAFLNFVVNYANGNRMPVMDSFGIQITDYARHTYTGPDTNLILLADIVPVRMGNEIVGALSIGDMSITFGLILLSASLLRRHPVQTTKKYECGLVT